MDSVSLYPIVFCGEQARNQSSLYHRGRGRDLKKGEICGFTTYFNSFSLKKWKKYTTLETFTLALDVEGSFEVRFISVNEKGNTDLLTETIESGPYEHTFSAEETPGILVGFSLKCLSEKGTLREGAWKGTFREWKSKKIGVSICTFKREEDVRRTIHILKEIQKTSGWLDILVVDNGNTLPPAEKDHFRLIYNRNFGGSGGFTRGLIEYTEKRSVDYVLLMDDDIRLEPSVILRTHSLLSGLKEEYRDSFLSGAMLSLEEPTLQWENTAYWGKIRLHGYGKNFDLSHISKLAENERDLPRRNRYGAWWYCCIPLKRVQEIGYPLPVFIKGDDMEYGIRNHRELIHMNGIGVWHQSFASKVSDVANYYADRNMLIINNYAEGCGFITLALAISGRILKKILKGNINGLYYINLALKDYNNGFQELTRRGADEKMAGLKKEFEMEKNHFLIPRLVLLSLKCLYNESRVHKDYLEFRDEELKTPAFWNRYLGLKK